MMAMRQRSVVLVIAALLTVAASMDRASAQQRAPGEVEIIPVRPSS